MQYLGLSGDLTPEQIRAAHAVHPITAVQLEWSLWEREAEVRFEDPTPLDTSHSLVLALGTMRHGDMVCMVRSC